MLAVGDIVPLLFAWRSQSPYGFVGTAKSEYYLRDSNGDFLRSRRTEGWSGSVYLPWERWLMSRSRCQAVFPRDRLTTEILKNWTIPAVDLGNPMMDGFLPALDNHKKSPNQNLSLTPNSPPGAAEPLRILILPGSRSPEAYRNWTQLMDLGTAIVDDQPHRPIQLEGAIAPGVALAQLAETLSAPWQRTTPNTWNHGNGTLTLTVGDFYQRALKTHLSLAMAGTATEQLVGLGQPVIILAGQGPQFTPAFAEAQTRLLGPSVFLADDANDGVKTARFLLQNPEQWGAIAANGRDRLGVPGAANRIAKHLLKLT
ncbi:MAG: lipid-A-disaccharide synthase-related protein [Cyanophyceae cyanobacterium]